MSRKMTKENKAIFDKLAEENNTDQLAIEGKFYSKAYKIYEESNSGCAASVEFKANKDYIRKLYDNLNNKS